MVNRSIAQVLVNDTGIVAHSPEFRDDQRSEVARIVDGFALPVGVVAPATLFAVPFGRRQVTVVSLHGRTFRFLVLDRRLFGLIPDPFAIADRFPVEWNARHELSALEWPAELLPARTVEQLQAILKGGDGPFLLGASQTLVDSGRIRLHRPEPVPDLFRDLWSLLPDSTRRQTWVTTFAYAPTLEFGLMATADPSDGAVGYLTEDQARDYPESRYERELQVAVELPDQAALDRLLHRRSSAETLRMALWMVIGVAVVSFAAKIMSR